MEMRCGDEMWRSRGVFNEISSDCNNIVTISVPHLHSDRPSCMCREGVGGGWLLIPSTSICRVRGVDLPLGYELDSIY